MSTESDIFNAVETQADLADHSHQAADAMVDDTALVDNPGSEFASATESDPPQMIVIDVEVDPTETPIPFPTPEPPKLARLGRKRRPPAKDALNKLPSAVELEKNVTQPDQRSCEGSSRNELDILEAENRKLKRLYGQKLQDENEWLHAALSRFTRNSR